MTHAHEEIFRRIKEVRAQVLEHTCQTWMLAVERRDLMQVLVKDGLHKAMWPESSP